MCALLISMELYFPEFLTDITKHVSRITQNLEIQGWRDGSGGKCLACYPCKCWAWQITSEPVFGARSLLVSHSNQTSISDKDLSRLKQNKTKTKTTVESDRGRYLILTSTSSPPIHRHTYIYISIHHMCISHTKNEILTKNHIDIAIYGFLKLYKRILSFLTTVLNRKLNFLNFLVRL